MSPNAESEILRQLDRMTTALFGVQGQESTGFINRTEEALEEHDKRINKVEQWMWRLVGAGALIALALGYMRH